MIWIPTANRLPSDESMKLVTCETKKGVKNVNRAYYSDGFWHGSGSMSNVIAWANMPKPYDGTDEDDKLADIELVIKIPEKTYHMINAGFYDYGDMNVIIQNGIPLPKGHWIEQPCVARTPFARQWKCSNCGEWAFKTAFCPNCMAKMQEEQRCLM